SGDIDLFHEAEVARQHEPHAPGPLKDLLTKVSRFQRIESLRAKKEKDYRPALRVAIISARSAPSNERFVTTLKSWDIDVDETFFLGGIEKKRILDVLKPHIFFDDQLGHIESAAATVPSVHIPFGCTNNVGGVAPTGTKVS